MDSRTPIRIVKKKELDLQKRTTGKAAEVPRSAQQKTRDLVGTVSDWVTEFQQKRRRETEMALKTLFPEPPTPTGA